MTIRLLLVRHGRPDFASHEFLQTPRGRQWDPPLDQRGRDQAEALAARLTLMDRPARTAVSPFRRCRETIAPFLERSGIQPAIDDDLGEVFVGEWEGRTFEEITAGDEALARRFREQEPMFILAPGGEGGPRLRQRVVTGVERAMAGVEDGIVVVVAHGGVINAYLGHVMGIARDMFFLPDHTSINSVMADGDRREMVFLNDVRHLTDPAIFSPPAGVGEHADSR